MHDEQVIAPDNTAVRTALWRALHVEADASPHVFNDIVGLQLAAPDADWRNRQDMSSFTRPFRASIVARARFIEDLVTEQVARGVEQYIILGAGLDTFVQRVFRCMRSINPARKHGSGSASSSLALAFHHICGWCQSTSKQAILGGSD